METPNAMRAKIVGKAGGDADFRARLLRDPKAAIGAELGIAIPNAMTIEVHEEDAKTAHIVLPPRDRLDEDALRGARGGIQLGAGEYERAQLVTSRAVRGPGRAGVPGGPRPEGRPAGGDVGSVRKGLAGPGASTGPGSAKQGQSSLKRAGAARLDGVLLAGFRERAASRLSSRPPVRLRE